MKVEALIMSVGEPQLERCLESVYNQTIPFSNVLHIKDVVPETKAHNMAMEQLSGDWVLNVNGDMILYKNAVEMALEAIKNYNNDKIFAFYFALYDSFLHRIISGCTLFCYSIYKLVPYRDVLKNNDKAVTQLEKAGYFYQELWKRSSYRRTIGTHFEDPDEFQIFRRFYARALKRDRDFTRRELVRLVDRFGSPQYDLALRAFDFGMSEFNYPTSHNIDFDMEMFRKFNGGA